MLLFNYQNAFAQYEWDNIPIPANPGNGNVWSLENSLSDDFSYTASFGAGEFASRSNFGPNNQWYNFYHNPWDGPGYTYWDNSNVSVDGDNLVITVGYTPETTKGGTHGVASGCVTSNARVSYPVYVESSLSVANISLASCFWLLSPDDTEEIDIIENYGGVDWFKNYTHISHHSFVRNPFTDYQPRDRNSWYPIPQVTAAGGWGPYCWNGGNRRYMRMGVNWIGPKHWEYYINGELVRVMYYNAMATKINGTWQYTYYNSVTANANGYFFPTNGGDGYSLVTTHSTSNNYSFNTLKAASNASNGYSVIDTGWFQGGDNTDEDGNGITVEAKGFTKELDIIINMESQSWLTNATPSQSDLNSASKNQMKVDWVRVYKPVGSNSGGGGGASSITIEAEDLSSHGGTFDDGYVPFGVNINTGTGINWVNKGDYADYQITIPEDGAYEITYYVSSPMTGSTIKFGMGSNVWNSTIVPNSGSWENYQPLKAIAKANFTKGKHVVRLSAGGTNWTWNLDRFALKKVGAINSRAISMGSESSMNDQLLLVPNPATDFVGIQGLGQGRYEVSIFSMEGIKVSTQTINGSFPNLSLDNLSPGLYLVKVSNKTMRLVVE